MVARTAPATCLGSVAIVLALGCAARPEPAPADASRAVAATLPQTRAERSGYTVTSSHADVLAFLDALGDAQLPFHRGVLGTTTEGREIPFVIASRPLVRTPGEARALARPIVFVQGNIHSGEVEGKEVLQAMVRDLLADPRPNVLDSIVLIAVPNYNADGNERLGPQARQRGSQQGPELVGIRPNAQGLNLNRDYIKAEAPETRASLAFVRAWDPHVFVDLHTTNGSFHGYALTYAPSLYPDTPVGGWTRDALLPELRRRIRDRHQIETFDYGNFGGDDGPDDPTSIEKSGWYSYDHRPRFGTNYFALRNRVSILSEAYSHDPFERRVEATRAFVAELLSLVAERGGEIARLTTEQDAAARRLASSGAAVAVQGRLTTTPRTGEVLVERLERTGDTLQTEAGLRRGLRRTGDIRPVRMPIVDRFETAREAHVPAAFALDARDSTVVALLQEHGVEVRRLASPWRGTADLFTPDSIVRAARAFEGHRDVQPLTGRWSSASVDLPVGTWIVDGDQRLARLMMVLLHPESDDGVVTWNLLDDRLAAGQPVPVRLLRERPR